MNFLGRFFGWAAGHLLPSEANQYRPNALSRDVLMTAVALVCVVEGFLVASLFIHAKPDSFAAAVLESALVSMTNDQRALNGEAALHLDPKLSLAAQAKANDMAARGYFSHTGPNGEQPWVWFRDAGYDYAYAGENLATRFYESSDVVTAWMNSPGHRANILKGAYQDIGIGISRGTFGGQEVTFVVQFFGTSRQELGLAPSRGAAVAASVPTPKQEVQKDKELSSPNPSLADSSSMTKGVPVASVQPIAAAPVPNAPIVEGESASTIVRPNVPGSVARFLSSPRTIALFLLGAIIAFLILAIALAILVRVHIQPVDLLMNGTVVAMFTLALFLANAYFLSGADISPGVSAAITSITQ